MVRKVKKTGKRLSPEVRITSILDVTSKIVAIQGLSAVTMERVAKEAGISKGLVYNYFPDRIDLLAGLLERELAVTYEKVIDAVEGANDLESMIRYTNRIYLKHMQDKGAILQRLFSDPSVVEIVNERRHTAKEFSRNYLIKLIGKNFGLPENLSKFVIDLSAGLTSSAANYVYEQNDVDFQLAEDVCVDMTLAVAENIARRHNKN